MKILALALVLFSQLAYANHSIQYFGNFEEPTSTDSSICEEIFEQREYSVKHFWFGPTGRTSILYFEGSDDATGFFSDRRYVGNYGGRGDVHYTEEREVEGGKYQILIRGILDETLVLVDAEIRFVDENEELVCDITSRYFGRSN